METPVSKLSPGWHLSGYERALSEGLRHKSCPALRAQPLNLEALPPNEVKLQVPSGGRVALASSEQDRFSGVDSGSLQPHLGGRRQRTVPRVWGAAGCARSPFSWPVLPVPTSCIQVALSASAAQVSRPERGSEGPTGRGSFVCHGRFGTCMTSVPLSSPRDQRGLWAVFHALWGSSELP